MNDTSKICIAVVAIFALMAGCSAKVASAHTGFVSCNDTGVIFTYNNNFANNTDVTETVNGVDKHFTVPAHTSITDTIVSTGSYQAAKASWTDGNARGSIALVELTCPYTAPPPDLCQNVLVTKTVYTPGPETIKYIPFETTTYIDRWHTKIKKIIKVRWKLHVIFIEKWYPSPRKHGHPELG